MNDIEKDMENMAERMEKSVQDQEFSKEMLQATVLRLGAEGLRKAIPRLSDVQKAMLSEVLEDMKKSHRALIARDKGVTTEPQSNSTPEGDYLHNEDVKPAYTEHDETLNEEARKRGQMVHRNQGGNNAPEGWEGQVIKSAAAKEKAKDKLLEMEEKEHGTKDPKKLIEEEKKEQGLEKAKDVKEPEEKTEQKKKEDKAERDSHKDKSPGEKKFEAELSKAGEEAFGGDGDRIMKCSHEMGSGKCAGCMKKSEEKPEEKEQPMNLEDKKKAAGQNLKKMMKRMQERKMEKSVCVAHLAKSLEVEESKLAEIWDHLAKGASEHQGPKTDGFKYDDGKTGTAPSEATEQSRVPAQMKKGEDAGVHDKESAETPAYKDKAAKKVEGGKKPESGRATETADETISKVPDTIGHKGDMKKGFWHEEEDVYLAKSENPFSHRTTGQNVAYKVDEYVEAETVAHKERLAKSTFDYESDEEILAKGGSGSGRHKEKIVTGPLEYKDRDKKPGNLLAQQVVKKADPEAEAAEQAKEVNRQSAQAAKEEKESQRQAQVDEKLTRIEERSGPKIAPQLRKDFDGSNAAEGMMKMKKSWINDLLEKGLDLGDDQALVAQANRSSEAKGAFLVKSFADDEMESLFKSQDMWKK